MGGGGAGGVGVIWHILSGIFKLCISVVLSGLVVFVTYRVFIKANTDFDEEVEIKKGNAAVGLLVAALLIASATIINHALSPVFDLVSLSLDFGLSGGLSARSLALYAALHLLLAFVLCVIAISASLRLFGKLTRGKMRMGVELEKGNMAVGLVLSGVVLVTALYIGDGIQALCKALVPQPQAVSLRVMK